MARSFTLSRPLAIGLLLGAGLSGSANAVPAEQRLELSGDGAAVDVHVQNSPRRAVIERLFAGRQVVIEWRDNVFADELVTGQFKGAPASVVRQLLGASNYVMSYVASGADERRPAKLVVIGKSKVSGNDRPHPQTPAVAEGPARPKAKDRTPVSVPGPDVLPDYSALLRFEDAPTRVAAGPQSGPVDSTVAPTPAATAQSDVTLPLPTAKPDENAPVPKILPPDASGSFSMPVPQSGSGENLLPAPAPSGGDTPVVPVLTPPAKDAVIPMPKPAGAN